MKSIRKNNLHYYNSSIVTRVVATISGSDGDSKITSLWHKRSWYVVGVVRRHMHDPNKGHWQAEKWIL